MGFRYTPYESRYANTIGELLLRQGDIGARQAEAVAGAQSRALEVSGQANARAAEQRGAAWSGALSNIGQTVAAIPGQMAQAKRQGLQDEAAGLQIGETKRAIAQRDAFSKIIRETPQLDEDGVALYDIGAVSKQLAAAGMDPGAAVEHLGKLNDAFRSEKAAKLALVKTGAASVAAAGNDPSLANHFLDQLERNGTYPREQIGQFREFISADPTNVAKLTSYLMGPQKAERGAPGSVAVDPITHLPIAGSQVPDPKADAAAAQATARQAEIERHNKETERIAALTAGRAEAAQKETARHNAATEAIERGKATAAAGDRTDLSPAGLDAAALNYAKTGTLPPLGNGDKNTRKSIINRAAEMMPGLDIASAKADFEANKSSLTAIQKQRDALGAFEETALKNLDVFLSSAEKVFDTGSPLLNKPIRSLSEKMFGGDAQTAFTVARRTVIPEFAKILANPGLSGQLSDSARHEIEEVVSGSATLKQLMAAARVLKQDTENRRTSYDDQIAGIKARISKATEPPKVETPETGGFVVQTPEGPFTFPTQAKADAFKKAAGIK